MPKPRSFERRDENDPAFRIPWIPERGIANAQAQAGGGNEHVDELRAQASIFNKLCEGYLSTIYNELGKHYDMHTRSGIRAWLSKTQGETQDDVIEQLEDHFDPVSSKPICSHASKVLH